jgi:putative inorganic carbon (HCO3(-)) transporter
MSEPALSAHLRRWLPSLAAASAAAVMLAAFSVTTTWAGLAVECAVLAAVFYLRPRVGLYLVVLSIPYAFAVRRVGDADISANDLLLFAAVAGRALRGAGTWWLNWKSQRQTRMNGFPAGRRTTTADRTWRRHYGGIDWAVGFFVVVCLASVLVGEDKRSALWELRVVVLQPLLLYLLVRTEPLSKEHLLGLGDALVVGASSLALIGLYYYFVLNYVEAAEGVRRLLVPFYDSPNHISLLLDRVAPIGLALVIYGSSGLRRVLHGLGLAIMLAAIYLTYSRGAWLVGLPAALLFVLLQPQLTGARQGRRRALVTVLVVLALGMLALIPVARTTRFASLAQLNSGTSFLRLVLWRGALHLIAAHPLLGTGIGNFANQYPHYMLAEAWREPLVYHAHNILLDFWAILGLPGLAALFWLQIAFWKSGAWLYPRLPAPALRALMLGLMGSMVASLAHGLVDTAFFLADLALVFMLTLALTRRLEADCMQPTSAPNAQGNSPVARSGALGSPRLMRRRRAMRCSAGQSVSARSVRRPTCAPRQVAPASILAHNLPGLSQRKDRDAWQD